MKENNPELLDVSDIELIFHTFSILLLLSLFLRRGRFSPFSFLLLPSTLLASRADSRTTIAEQNLIIDESPAHYDLKNEPTPEIAHSLLAPVDYNGETNSLALAEDAVETLYKCSGSVNSIKMADVVLLGESHDDKWHRKLVKGIRRSFDLPGHCWLSEGLQYSTLSPWKGYGYWRQTGWEDMSLPTWALYNVSKQAYDTVRDFYYENVTAEVDLKVRSNCTFLSIGPEKGAPLSVLLNMGNFPEFNSIYALGDQNASLALLLEVQERALETHQTIQGAINHIDRTALGHFMKALCAHGTLEINSPEQACKFVVETDSFLRSLPYQTEKMREAEVLTQMELNCVMQYREGNSGKLLEQLRWAVSTSDFFIRQQKPISPVFAKFIMLLGGASSLNNRLAAYDKITARNEHAAHVVHEALKDCDKVFVQGGKAHFTGIKATPFLKAIADTNYINCEPRENEDQNPVMSP